MLRHLRNPRLLATYAVGFGTLFNFIALFTYVNFLLAAPPFNLSPTLLGAIFVTYLAGAVAVLVARPRRRALRAPHADHRHHRGVDRAAHCSRSFRRCWASSSGSRSRRACGFFTQATSTGLCGADRGERTHLGDRALRHLPSMSAAASARSCPD